LPVNPVVLLKVVVPPNVLPVLEYGMLNVPVLLALKVASVLKTSGLDAPHPNEPVPLLFRFETPPNVFPPLEMSFELPVFVIEVVEAATVLVVEPVIVIVADVRARFL
jgi:hypothetical protein